MAQKGKLSKQMLSLLLCYTVMMSSIHVHAQDVEIDYYLLGQEVAEEQYDGRGVVLGGLIAGILLNFISLSLGSMVFKHAEVDIPSEYLKNLPEDQRPNFEAGYSDYVKKIIKRNYIIGSVVGIAGSWGVLFYNMKVNGENN